MRLHRNHILGPIKALSAPLVATAVIAAGAGLHAYSDTDIPLRSDRVELVATIDTAADAAGIAESNLYYMSQTDLNAAMQQMQDLGVTQIRVLLPWREMEPSDGSYSWAKADQLLNTAKTFGIAVDAVVTSTPNWATNYGGVLPYGEPKSPADYASFVSALAQRYGSSNGTDTGKISAIEVWNEPNGKTGWYPTPNAQGYTDLLKAAYTAIKEAAPGITVVGGVLGAGMTFGDWSTNPVTFLQQMYDAGAAGYFDALSFHPYNATGTFSDGALYANSALKQLQALRALMNANGDIAKLIWATEYGQSSSGQNGEATQAAYIQDFLDTWSKIPGVGPMFLYSLIDDPEGNKMGLFTKDGIAKAAVEVLKAWLAAHPTENPTASTPGTVVGTIGDAIQALTTAIAAAVNNVVAAVKNVVTNIANALSNLLKALNPKATTAAAAKQLAAVEVSMSAMNGESGEKSGTELKATTDEKSAEGIDTEAVAEKKTRKEKVAEEKVAEKKVTEEKADDAAATDTKTVAEEKTGTGTKTDTPADSKADDTKAGSDDSATTEAKATGRKHRGHGKGAADGSNPSATAPSTGSSDSDGNTATANPTSSSNKGKKDKTNKNKHDSDSGTTPGAGKPKSTGPSSNNSASNRNKSHGSSHPPKHSASHH